MSPPIILPLGLSPSVDSVGKMFKVCLFAITNIFRYYDDDIQVLNTFVGVSFVAQLAQTLLVGLVSAAALYFTQFVDLKPYYPPNLIRR